MLYKKMNLRFSLYKESDREVRVPCYRYRGEYKYVKLGPCKKVHTFLVDGKDLSDKILKKRVDQFVEKLVKLEGLRFDEEDRLREVEVIWENGKMSVNAIKKEYGSEIVEYQLKDLNPIEFLWDFGVIEKIGVYCYEVENTSESLNGVISTKYKNLIIIGNNEVELEDRTEYYRRSGESIKHILVHSAELHGEEIRERFNLDEYSISHFLGGENLELDHLDLDLPHNRGLFDECKLTISEIRERRRIESEPFDAEEIIRKIASEYVITPRRKESLIEMINKLL